MKLEGNKLVILLSDLLPTYFLRLLFWYILCQESRRPLMTQFCNFLCNYINSLFSDRKCYGNKLFNCLTNHKWSFQEERKKNVFLFFMNYIPLYAICTNKVNKRFCHFMITYKKKASLSLFFSICMVLESHKMLLIMEIVCSFYSFYYMEYKTLLRKKKGLFIHGEKLGSY